MLTFLSIKRDLSSSENPDSGPVISPIEASSLMSSLSKLLLPVKSKAIKLSIAKLSLSVTISLRFFINTIWGKKFLPDCLHAPTTTSSSLDIIFDIFFLRCFDQ